jgi:hypothetical protein
MRNHENPDYRKRHPCLHYFVWDSLGPDVKSAWAILSAPEPTNKLDTLTLNGLEMWSALVLQTLPKDLLTRYLNCPREKLSPRAGCHLNIASPLSQSDQSNRPEDIELGNIYKSDDPAMREYYKERQGQYLQLRVANDPILRNYWWDNHRRGVEARSDNNRKSTRTMILDGMKAKVGLHNRVQTFHLGPCTFRIPLTVVRLDLSKPVHVQCVITDEPDNDCYALDSSPSDDAARLLMRLRGTNTDGKRFDGPAYAGGTKTVFQTNSLFDLLVGRSLKESLQLPRRSKRMKESGKRQTKYTSSF